ncbi:hypothetical protein JG688_00018480, partial [Phytophthora aleatoria]
AGVKRAVGQAVVTERREHGTSEQEARGTSRAAGAVADGSEALGNTAAGVVAVDGARERMVMSTKKLFWSVVHKAMAREGVVREDVVPVAAEWTLVVMMLQLAKVVVSSKLGEVQAHPAQKELASVRWEKSVLVAVVLSTKKLLRGVEHEGVVHESVVIEDVVPVVAVRVGRRHELQTLQMRLAFKVARGIWRD